MPHRFHICTGTGLTASTSAPGPGSPLPYLHRDLPHPLPLLHRDWAHPCHICTGTGLTPCHICTGTGVCQQVVELSEQVLVDEIVLINYEFYAAFTKDFQVQHANVQRCNDMQQRRHAARNMRRTTATAACAAATLPCLPCNRRTVRPTATATALPHSCLSHLR